MFHTTTRSRAVFSSVIVFCLALTADAQVKYPPLPETVDLEIRYRIRADRDERVRQFRLLEGNLKSLGFLKKRLPNDNLDILDPNAERFEGKIPSKNVFAVLDDPRVRTILFKPTDLQAPDSAEKPSAVRLYIANGFLSPDQQRLHRQVVAQLGRLGFKEAVGYDTRGYTIVRGELPSGNLFRLLKDLRNEPAGWFLSDVSDDQLPAPLRDTLPIRAIEVLADAGMTLLNPQILPPPRASFTPDLREALADEQRRLKPARVEVIYDYPLDKAQLDLLRARLRTAYLSFDINPVTQLREQAFPTIEGIVGNILTIRFPAVANVERFMQEPGIVSMRLARAAQETSAPSMMTIPAPDLLASTKLDQLQKLGYKGQGTRVVVIGTEFPGVAKALGFHFLDRTFSVPIDYVDLTIELSPDLIPAPVSGRAASGLAAAYAAHVAAPDARLVLVRVDPAAMFQLMTIAKSVRGEIGSSDAARSRVMEFTARAEELRKRNSEAVEEYRKAIQNITDDEEPRLRRERAQKALEQVIEDERQLAIVVSRFTTLEKSLTAMKGANVVINTLVWETGFPLDGLSALSQEIDQAFAGEAVAAPLNRSATRPLIASRPLWVQAASPSAGSVWSGPFLDPDGSGTMDFAETRTPLPAGSWTRGVNFLATRAPDGKTTANLPAGAKLRLSVQWRETHDPTTYGGRDSIFPLTLRVFQQLDPTGEKRATDELQEVARSAGLAQRIIAEPGYGVYEQIVEFSVPADGRYCVRIEGRPLFDPRLPAIRQHIEVNPRLFVEFISGSTKGTAVFATFAPRNCGVGIPGDAKAAVTVDQESGGLVSGGPGLSLLVKPDLLLNSITTPIGLGGSAVSAGFVAGSSAATIGAGAPASDLFRAIGLRRGSVFQLPENWLRGVPPRNWSR